MSSGKMALYQRIADDLRQKVAQGVYEPGTSLPAIADLAKAYGVSDAPVRRALDILKTQGVLFGRAGSGVYVRKLPPLRRHGIDRYRRSVWLHGGRAILEAEAGDQAHLVHQEVRELAEVPASDFVAERLELQSGAAVWVRRRRTFVDDTANQLADSYYPLDVAEAAPLLREENTGPGGGFARLHEAGFEPTRGLEEITVRIAPGPEERELLDLPETMPVIDLVRTVFDQHGRPVEVMLAVMHPQLASFAYPFEFED
ncbi:GntR family transcriptional regulator [Amycolatopsis kentuckyensis]|uniref:GntR family transcriptional regulator n=1 Tax=Amycolatopsis kentuckyensis TaxID=218823 RepID=UPI00356B1375